MDYKFSTWISNLEKSYGSRMAVNSGSSSLSYYELLNSSQQCAMILNSLGVKKGDRVALWAANGADWTVAFFGIVMSGGVAVLVNYGLSADNVSKDINTVQAEWAVIGSNKVSSIDDSLAKNAVEKGGVPSDHVIKLDYL